MASGDGDLIRSTWFRNTTQFIRVTDTEGYNQTERSDYMLDWMFVPAAVGGTTLKVWDGSAWVAKPIKVWDGATWTAKTLKRFVSGTWV
jgi:hypothetical protein